MSAKTFFEKEAVEEALKDKFIRQEEGVYIFKEYNSLVFQLVTGGPFTSKLTGRSYVLKDFLIGYRVLGVFKKENKQLVLDNVTDIARVCPASSAYAYLAILNMSPPSVGYWEKAYVDNKIKFENVSEMLKSGSGYIIPGNPVHWTLENPGGVCGARPCYVIF